MSAINDALHQVGVDLTVDAASNLIGAIGDYNKQNLSPGDLALANAGMRVLAQATNVGALSPGVVVRGVKGEFESVHYADDLNNHHPKLKFLFKVQFNGFPGGNFSYFVHRCDKPKVRFNHTEVNFYSFRTKVLTSVGFDPLSFTFLDEIGNTVNSFFAQYVAARSNQGNGRASITGGGEYSSTIPYDNGYSSGATVEIQQIFGNGLATNIFTLINARIDAFDELNMELSAGSMMSCTVSYDAISCKTTGPNKINSWGQTDLYAGGGTSGQMNAGSSSTDVGTPASGTGGGIGGQKSFLTTQTDSAFKVAIGALTTQVPPALADLVTPQSIVALTKFNQPGVISSSGNILSQNIQNTIKSITSGDNLKFGGSGENPNYSHEGRNADTSNYSNEGKNHKTIYPTPAPLVSGGGGDFGGGGASGSF